VLSEYEQGLLSLRRAYLNDSVNHTLPELDVSLFFQAVSKELEQNVSLLRQSMIQKSGGLNDLNLEVNA
jgi:hypothetical protein